MADRAEVGQDAASHRVGHMVRVVDASVRGELFDGVGKDLVLPLQRTHYTCWGTEVAVNPLFSKESTSRSG